MTAMDDNSLTGCSHGVPMARRSRDGIFAVILVLLWVPAAFGQGAVPVGSEIQINTFGVDEQWYPAVAGLGDGGFVAVWQSTNSSDPEEPTYSIRGQRYAVDGATLGGEVRIDTYIRGVTGEPAVAGLPGGGYVVVWHSAGSYGTDISGTSIQGRIYAAGGEPVGDQFQINTMTDFNQLIPAVAALDGGGFVVVWHSIESGIGFRVHGRIYAADGQAQGDQFLVTDAGDGGFDATVVGLTDGRFVVTWQTSSPGGSDHSSFSVQGRLYDAGGMALGPRFQLNSYTPNTQALPVAVAFADGGFVAVWQSWGSSGTDVSRNSIQGQRFTAEGVPVGPEFQVNSLTHDSQRAATIAAEASGGFVVVWQTPGISGTDASGFRLQGQRYAADGSSLGGEFQVNITDGIQADPSVAALAGGGFAVVWQSFEADGPDNSRWSVRGQRYAVPRFALVGLGGKCLDVAGASPADGTPVNLFRCHGGDNQRWRMDLTSVPQEIRGLGGKCLVPGPVDDAGDVRVVIGDCEASGPWQLITGGSSSPSFLTHVETGLCLDAQGGIGDDGTPAILFECHGGSNQIWRPATEICTRDSLGLCLNQQRYRIDVDWRSFDGTTGSGQAVAAGTDDSGLLWFFEADNWEMLIKVLDGCTINDRVWVFAGATTTVEYTVRVTDTALGTIREYHNPLGNAAAAITDIDAFTCSAGAVGVGLPRIERATPIQRESPTPPRQDLTAADLKGSCNPSTSRLCLSDNRFSVEAEWRDFDGNVGSAQAVPVGSEDSGLFYFFSANNWEMLVKVLDACHLDDSRFLMLAAATTDVEYTLRVTDTLTGTAREYFNPLGNDAAALVDEFETCP